MVKDGLTHFVLARTAVPGPRQVPGPLDRDADAIRLRPEATKTGRGRTVMLEGDLAELIDHRGPSAP